ncbi:Vesicle-associated protein 1-1 [Sesamum angolense]|uniref:Vesicle-associated protein 1-1 n=1 Tax=Sesamum angolense TaxID=2727404 RepID=A0AAE1T991_9LAMI|nr:Vesicle-associated protein 1-1 [Sesamum angolense]
MSTADLLQIEPLELQFPFELKKQISCSMQLTNKSDNYVAFKVKTTNPKKYCVRPNTGVVMPRSTCDVIVTMQAQKEAPPDMQCRDKFLLQSVVVNPGITAKDITPEMVKALISKLTEDKRFAIQQNNKLQQEVELLRRQCNKSQGGIPFMYVIIVGLIETKPKLVLVVPVIAQNAFLV